MYIHSWSKNFRKIAQLRNFYVKSEFKKGYYQIEFYPHIKYFISPQQEDSATEYLVATTSMINGNSLIQGLMSDIQDPMAFWKKKLTNSILVRINPRRILWHFNNLFGKLVFFYQLVMDRVPESRFLRDSSTQKSTGKNRGF